MDNPSLRQKFERLRSSPLARTLGSYFLVLFLIQGLAVSWLTFDVWQAEQKAAHEYKMLMASEQIAMIADELRKHRRLVDYWRDKAVDGVAIREFQDSRLALIRAGQDFSKSWAAASLDPARAKRMTNMIAAIGEIGSRMFNPAASSESREGVHKEFRLAYEQLYYLGLGEINSIREQIDKENGTTKADDTKGSGAKESVRTVPRAPFHAEPLIVLALAALANIGLGIYIAMYADRYLSGRVIRLAELCERLKRSEVLPAPLEQRNEVDSLQQTFHTMSLRIAEIEKGRRSYIHLLKDLQGASLQRARANLQELASRQTDKKREDRFNMLKTAVGGMIHLLETMTEGLQFRAEQKLEPQFQLMSSTAIFAQATSSVQALLDKKKITVAVNDPACDVEVDPHLLNRLIVNLLSNAIKFSPKESRIELTGSLENQEFFHCEVRDAGPGISESDQKKLFQAFSQVGDNTEAKRSGTGLGLMICKQIVTAHGGEISCRSTPPDGSTFWFRIPARQQDRPPNVMRVTGVAESESVDTARGISLPATGATTISNPLSPESSKQRNKSMKTALILAVIVFSILQTALAFSVGSKIDEVEKRTQSYLEQQQLVIETERFMGLFLTWRVKAKTAIQDWNEKDLRHSHNLLEEQKALIDKLVAMTKGEKALQSTFRECKRRLNYLSKTTETVLSRFSTLSMFALAETIRRADVIGMEIEDQIFYQLRIERGMLEMSYELADQLRAELFTILLLSGLINALLILWLSSFVLNLLNRTAELTAKAGQFAAGDTPAVTCTAQDELSYLDASLCEAATSIRNAEKQRQQLLSIVNHDLRTPMASVLGGLEIVKEGILGELPAADLQVVDQADREMRLHLTQINDLLALEQLEAGTLEPKNEQLVLADALEDAVDLCRGKWRGRVELEFSVSPELEDATIIGESELLTRMFKAVIENALTATEKAHSKQPVRVMLKREEGKIVAAIGDAAGGIPAQLQTQIFDRFRFLGDHPLTGMGLPLAFRLAKIHSAELTVTSSAEGTTAKFAF